MTVEWHRDICPNYILLPLSRSCLVPLCGRQVTFKLGSAENLGEKLFFFWCCLPSLTPLRKGTHCGLVKHHSPRGVVSIARRDCSLGTCARLRPSYHSQLPGKARPGACRAALPALSAGAWWMWMPLPGTCQALCFMNIMALANVFLIY